METRNRWEEERRIAAGLREPENRYKVCNLPAQ
jgi:hypothetical protein